MEHAPLATGARVVGPERLRNDRAAMPGYQVVGVYSESTIVQGGSIHCVTREIPTVTATS